MKKRYNELSLRGGSLECQLRRMQCKEKVYVLGKPKPK